MNGQNPNNQDNQVNNTVLGSTQSLGQVPPAPTGQMGVPPATPPASPSVPLATPPVSGATPPVTPAPTSEPPAQGTPAGVPTEKAGTPSIPPATPEATPSGTPNPVGQAPINPPMPSGSPLGTMGSTSPAPATPAPNANTVVNPSGSPVDLSATTPTGNGAPAPNGSVGTGTDPVNVNGFVEANKTENIGTIPPTPNNNPADKKKISKPVFIVIVVVLIAAVAFGVFTVLNRANNKNKVSIQPMDVTINIGDQLSADPTDYAAITGTDVSSCSVNTMNVDTSNAGTYSFTLTCGSDGTEYTGNVIVVDNIGPTLNLNVVYKLVDEDVEIDEFVKSCNDETECKTEFANESALESNLKTAGGPYNVSINASDEAGNVVTVDAPLYVLSYKPSYFLVADNEATDDEETDDSLKYKLTTRDTLAFGNDGTGVVYLDAARREYIYEFETEDDYNTAVGKKDAFIKFGDNEGLAIYDDENKTLTISTDLSFKDLQKDDSTLEKTFASIRTYYVNKGYDVQIKNNNTPSTGTTSTNNSSKENSSRTDNAESSSDTNSSTDGNENE